MRIYVTSYLCWRGANHEAIGDRVRNHVGWVCLIRQKHNELLAVHIALSEQYFSHVVTPRRGSLHRGYLLVGLGSTHRVKAFWRHLW